MAKCGNFARAPEKTFRLKRGGFAAPANFCGTAGKIRAVEIFRAGRDRRISAAPAPCPEKTERRER